MKKQQVFFLNIVRSGIGHTISPLSFEPDWNVIKSLASQQGLIAIVLDGLNNLYQKREILVHDVIKQQELLTWMGEVYICENQYLNYKSQISNLAKFFNDNGFRMMILKGYGLSLNYPKPFHRPVGDIDIWLFGDYKRADIILLDKYGIKVKKNEPHHTIFEWNGYVVENHYDFLIAQTIKTNTRIEPILKKMATDDTHTIEINGEKVCLPSPNFNALFLLRHMLMHFVAIGINLRQILDWAFFVEKHTKKVDWKWLNGILEEFHMKEFFNIINAICVDDLGFNKEIFPSIQFLPELKERVLGDILAPEYDWMDAHRLNLIPRMLFKFRRWKSGAWKRKLCYKESDLETFLWGIRSHLLKPATI